MCKIKELITWQEFFRFKVRYSTDENLHKYRFGEAFCREFDVEDDDLYNTESRSISELIINNFYLIDQEKNMNNKKIVIEVRKFVHELEDKVERSVYETEEEMLFAQETIQRLKNILLASYIQYLKKESVKCGRGLWDFLWQLLCGG